MTSDDLLPEPNARTAERRMAEHPRLAELIEHARGLAEESQSPATRRAYANDWRDFTAWCSAMGAEPLPAAPEVVALYVAELNERGLKPSTVSRRLAAIRRAHLQVSLPSPTSAGIVSQVLAGVRRTRKVRPDKKRALSLEDLQAMVDALDLSSLTGARDHALLVTGFLGAFRRSELVALDVSDVEWRTEGVVLTLRSSKTDQEGQGRQVAIPDTGRRNLSSPRAITSWLTIADIDAGPLFRPIDRHGTVRQARLTPQSVALIVKRSADRIGLDADLYAGHSLRAGFATAAAAAGADTWAIRDTTGHRSVEMLGEYVRAGRPFENNAASMLLG
jgi:site-specific recombinase XerD